MEFENIIAEAKKLGNVKMGRNKNNLSCQITQSRQENLVKIIQENQSLTNHSVTT